MLLISCPPLLMLKVHKVFSIAKHGAFEELIAVITMEFAPWINTEHNTAFP